MIPMVDLRRQYLQLKQEIDAAVLDVLDKTQFILGPNVSELEAEVARYHGLPHAIGVANGTDALLLALRALGIGAGDEVITTPFTFIATAEVAGLLGAVPVFVDVDPKTFNIDPALIEKAVTKRTKAIIPVHLFGQPCDMDPILAVAKKHGLKVIEDCAQAFGARYKGRIAGTLGDAACFSFFPSKNLGGIGDGGMVVTNDEALYKRLMLMRNHGAEPKYYHRFVGANFRLDPVQAAALLVKLPHLDEWSEARRRNAAYYNEKFAGTIVQTPYISPDCNTIYNQYCIRVPRRDEVVAHLKARKIGCEIYYPVPAHLQECFAYLGYSEGDFPLSEEAAAEIMALPVYPELTNEMQDAVVEAILAFLR